MQSPGWRSAWSLVGTCLCLQGTSGHRLLKLTQLWQPAVPAELLPLSTGPSHPRRTTTLLWGWQTCPRYDPCSQVGWRAPHPALWVQHTAQDRSWGPSKEILVMNEISCYPPPKPPLKPTWRAVSWAGSITMYTLSKRNLGDPSVPNRAVDQGTGAHPSAMMGRGQQHCQGGDRKLGAATSYCSEVTK